MLNDAASLERIGWGMAITGATLIPASHFLPAHYIWLAVALVMIGVGGFVRTKARRRLDRERR